MLRLSCQQSLELAVTLSKIRLSLQGLPTPTVDWSTLNADESFENFKQTVELLFEAPLAELSEERKIAYLKLWSGEEGRTIIKTWELTDDE